MRSWLAVVVTVVGSATRRRGMQPAFAWVPFIREQRGRFPVTDRGRVPFDGAPVGQEFVEETTRVSISRVLYTKCTIMRVKLRVLMHCNKY